jgi:hypothetical protein
MVMSLVNQNDTADQNENVIITLQFLSPVIDFAPFVPGAFFRRRG